MIPKNVFDSAKFYHNLLPFEIEITILFLFPLRVEKFFHMFSLHTLRSKTLSISTNNFY